MNINFAMWRKASWELIKMDSKQEWDALDVISKWLIATRSAVTAVTVYSCIIAGMLAWRYDHFAWLPWLIVTVGLFIAHGTNNILKLGEDCKPSAVPLGETAFKLHDAVDQAKITLLPKFPYLNTPIPGAK